MVDDVLSFSILERIDVGETRRVLLGACAMRKLSVSSNGSTWVKHVGFCVWCSSGGLSVSSNGSTWVKRNRANLCCPQCRPFSILERIDVGETHGRAGTSSFSRWPFSILERIDVGETQGAMAIPPPPHPILSVSSNGSTWVKLAHHSIMRRTRALSVSSNGSTWVKRAPGAHAVAGAVHFQYPRTDRRG